MVPVIDERFNNIRPKDIEYGGQVRLRSAGGVVRPLLPSKSYMRIGEAGTELPGPGRANDF